MHGARWSLATLALVTLGALTQPRSPAADAGWVDLFNGKDLTGWVQKGGKAKYTVENGEIVGRTVPNTQNSFLCTTKDYADFVLELDFKVNENLNSGVQIRSHYAAEGENVVSAGKKIDIRPGGRVYGYQVEIDPDLKKNRMWTGGIYDEGRRAWLQDLSKNENGRKAFKPDEWNHFKIECNGDAIKVWLNGVSTADLKDPVDKSGFIALQVHQIGKKTDVWDVRFKNIKLKELK
jgi:hypothetical protein